MWDWGEVRLTDSEEHEGDSEEEEEGDQSKVSAERCDPARNDHLSTHGAIRVHRCGMELTARGRSRQTK